MNADRAPKAPPGERPRSFREKQFAAREVAILDATNALLADKGYEAMAMDDIAAAVGIAKGSLYKHFPSKEALAAAVMLRLVRRTQAALDAQPGGASPIERIRLLLEWTLRERLSGGVPHLPSTSAALRQHLLAERAYVDSLMQLSDDLGELIVAAKRDGQIDPALSDVFVLYYLYARSCDPTLDFLRAGEALADEEVVAQMVRAAMSGIAPQRASADSRRTRAARPPAGPAPASRERPRSAPR